MNFVRPSLAFFGLLALSLAPGRAAVLIGEFALQGSLNNNVPAGPALVLLPFSSVSGTITASGYVFGKDQGLTFTSPALTPASYSIELSFKLNLDSPATWSKLVDLSGVGSNDGGLYVHNNGGFRLQYYPQAEGIAGDFSAGTNVEVVLTRDGATNTVSGYVNGLFRFSFIDSSNQAVITAANTLTFFVDDHATSQNEVSSGTANYLRIYNGALTAGEVTALYAAGAPTAVPEPAASAVFLAVSAAGVLAFRRRSRR